MFSWQYKPRAIPHTVNQQKDVSIAKILKTYNLCQFPIFTKKLPYLRYPSRFLYGISLYAWLLFFFNKSCASRIFQELWERPFRLTTSSGSAWLFQLRMVTLASPFASKVTEPSVTGWTEDMKIDDVIAHRDK